MRLRDRAQAQGRDPRRAGRDTRGPTRPPKRHDERILGPYKHSTGWRIVAVRPGGPGGQDERRTWLFPRRETAEKFRADLEAQIVPTALTVGEGTGRHERALIETGSKAKSITEKLR